MKFNESEFVVSLKEIERKLTEDKKPKGNPYDEGYIDGVNDALNIIRNQLLWNYENDEEVKNEE